MVTKHCSSRSSSPLFWLTCTIGLVLLYWGISQIHSIICAPKGITGIIYTAISMSSPICHAIIAILNHAAVFYTIIWGTIIATFASAGWKFINMIRTDHTKCSH